MGSDCAAAGVDAPELVDKALELGDTRLSSFQLRSKLDDAGERTSGRILGTRRSTNDRCRQPRRRIRQFTGFHRDCESPVDAELRRRRRQMVFYGVGGNAQAAGDLTIGQSQGQQCKHFELTLAQGRHVGLVALFFARVGDCEHGRIAHGFG